MKVVRLKWQVRVEADDPYLTPWHWLRIGWAPGWVDASVVAEMLKNCKACGWRIIVERP